MLYHLMPLNLFSLSLLVSFVKQCDMMEKAWALKSCRPQSDFRLHLGLEFELFQSLHVLSGMGGIIPTSEEEMNTHAGLFPTPLQCESSALFSSIFLMYTLSPLILFFLFLDSIHYCSSTFEKSQDSVQIFLTFLTTIACISLSLNTEL